MSDLERVVETFRRWLYLPDIGALYAALGTVAANRLEGDPVWLLVVGPPGGGKSELLTSVAGLKDVHVAATITEAALLSGTPKKETDSSSSGGLLRVIGERGLILAKDFGSVLNMHRDARSAVLAALREVYDGSWTRHVGTDGGKTLHWSGHVGLLAGCTPTIDRHHAVMGAMGERFAFYRLTVDDHDEHTRRSLEHAGREIEMRSDLREAVSILFRKLDLSTTPPRVTTDVERLVNLATLVARARSAVERDGYSRDIELIPDAEAPSRLANVLRRLLDGLRAIGVEEAEAWTIVTKVGLDSIPGLRRALLGYIVGAGGKAESTPAIAEAVGYPTNTARRALEDLAAHGVLLKSGRTGTADVWEASPWLIGKWSKATVPEMSGGVTDGPLSKTQNVFDDFSGTVS